MWIKTASILMFLAVAIGAFGAHALKAQLTEYGQDIYKTAVVYHMAHALAIFAAAWIHSLGHDPKALYAAGCFTLGVLLFSGSLYILAVTGIKWLGAITPIGGLAFLAGWALLTFSRTQ